MGGPLPPSSPAMAWTLGRTGRSHPRPMGRRRRQEAAVGSASPSHARTRRAACQMVGALG